MTRSELIAKYIGNPSRALRIDIENMLDEHANELLSNRPLYPELVSENERLREGLIAIQQRSLQWDKTDVSGIKEMATNALNFKTE